MAFFYSMVISDLIVAKMAGRQLHYYVVLMATTVVVPHLQFLILCFVTFYYIAIFADLMNHMNMPLLQACKNVYCDGIYDLCHVGHKNLFRHALTYGNRLFVGVIGDEDANNYKRPPVMSAAEREAEVELQVRVQGDQQRAMFWSHRGIHPRTSHPRRCLR